MLYNSSVWNGIAMRSFWKVWPPYQWCTCSPDCQLERAFLFAFSTFERYIHLKVYTYPSVFVFNKSAATFRISYKMEAMDLFLDFLIILIRRWRMIMRIGKPDNVIIQSCNSAFTSWLFRTTLPSSLFGIFGHPFNGIMVVATINYDSFSMRTSGSPINTFSPSWNIFIEIWK